MQFIFLPIQSLDLFQAHPTFISVPLSCNQAVPPSYTLHSSKKHKYQPNSQPDSTQWWILNKDQTSSRQESSIPGRAAHCIWAPYSISVHFGLGCATYPKHCCTAHITSVCFCVPSLKIACLWAESAPNFNICFEPTSAHSSYRQRCFAWILIKSEQTRRKCFSPNRAGMVSSLYRCLFAGHVILSFPVLSVDIRGLSSSLTGKFYGLSVIAD